MSDFEDLFEGTFALAALGALVDGPRGAIVGATIGFGLGVYEARREGDRNGDALHVDGEVK